MEKSNNKALYIIIGLVLLLVAIPILIMIVGMIAGFVFYSAGAQ